MKTNIRIFCGMLVAACVMTSVASATTLIGVQMAGRSGGPNDQPTPALAPTDVAGVIPQNNWNKSTVTFSGNTGTLNNSTGGATPVTLTMAGINDSWNSGTGTGTPDRSLLNGISKAAFSDNLTATFTFNNLTGRYWELIAYTEMNGSGSLTDFSATGSSTTFYTTEQNGGAYGGSFVQASNTINNNANRDTGNYVRFPFLDIGAGNSITFTMVRRSGSDGAGIAGLQIRSSAVPEPSTLLLVASGLGALYVAGKRARKA